MNPAENISRRKILQSSVTVGGLAGTALLAQTQTSASAYSKENTALLIVDPYNDFMSEGGKLYKATLETATEAGFYENMKKLIPAVRASGIAVVIVPHHRAAKGDYDKWLAVNSSQRGSAGIMLFAAGTWGGEWHPEFGPKPGDIVIKEHWLRAGSQTRIWTSN
jgi:nicotinamidase-related amidase